MKIMDSLNGIFTMFVTVAIVGSILFVLGGFAGGAMYDSMAKDFEPRIETLCNAYGDEISIMKCNGFFHITESNKMFFNDKPEWDKLVASQCASHYTKQPKQNRLRNTKVCIKRFNKYPYQFDVPGA